MSWDYSRSVSRFSEFDHPGTAAEGQAFFILMETLIINYLVNKI
jgi:hypothetical protein